MLKNNHVSPSSLHFVGLFSMPKSYQVRLCLRINITILLELVCLKNYSMTCCLRAKLTSMPGIGLILKTTKPYVRTHIERFLGCLRPPSGTLVVTTGNRYHPDPPRIWSCLKHRPRPLLLFGLSLPNSPKCPQSDRAMAIHFTIFYLKDDLKIGRHCRSLQYMYFM